MFTLTFSPKENSKIQCNSGMRWHYCWKGSFDQIFVCWRSAFAAVIADSTDDKVYLWEELNCMIDLGVESVSLCDTTLYGYTTTVHTHIHIYICTVRVDVLWIALAGALERFQNRAKCACFRWFCGFGNMNKRIYPFYYIHSCFNYFS